MTGKIIARRLAETGKTMEWLAEQAGVSIAAVAKWKKTGRLSREKVKPVAKALGISVGELLGEAPPEAAGRNELGVSGAELVYATPDEIHLLTAFREATPMGRDVIKAAAIGAEKQPQTTLPRRANES